MKLNLNRSVNSIFQSFLHKTFFNEINKQYRVWIYRNNLTDELTKDKLQESTTFKYQPVFLLIMNEISQISEVEGSIESVQNQIYPKFKLLINAEPEEFLLTNVTRITKQDQRIELVNPKTNFKQLIDKQKADFIAFFPAGTVLQSHALFEVVKVANENKNSDVVYSDEDSINESGTRLYPYFKPDWSPDLLLSMMYLGVLTFFSRRILRDLKINRTTFTKSMVWDLSLQAGEKTQNFFHIPAVLYSVPLGSKDPSGWEKVSRKEVLLQERNLKKCLERRSIKGKFEKGPFTGSFNVKYQVEKNPLVSIIISTKDKTDLLKKVVDGVLHSTSYKNIELMVINNRSVEEKSFVYLEKLIENPKIQLLHYNKPFNISAIFNWAAKKARGEFLVFMGNDTEPITKDWLERMVGHGQQDHIGAVGAKLLYPDNSIQHAGVVLGYGSQEDNSDRVAGHPFSRMKDNAYYFGTINLTRNYSAVTGACILTKRSVYLKVGGFDEKNLKIRFNDVDYCLKLRKLGYSIVYLPQAVLYHYESASVGKIKMDPKEIQYMREKWSFWEDNDPFYNPNLTLDRNDYTLRI